MKELVVFYGIGVLLVLVFFIYAVAREEGRLTLASFTGSMFISLGWPLSLPILAILFSVTPSELAKFTALVAEECAKEAAMFSIRKKPIHPDITFDEMPGINKHIVHVTCQCVAEEIRAKFALSNDKPEAK